MFTGIIEAQGIVSEIKQNENNREFIIKSLFTNELIIGQSIAHNGVCLTVTEIVEDQYTVTAVKETLERSNLGTLQIGDFINLERSMPANGRFEGHIVQGHVDQKGVCTAIQDQHGSRLFSVEYDPDLGNITVEKGSVCVNGVSLTVIDSKAGAFSVAVIPHTFDHTNFKRIKVGDMVNLEFDILGKYISKLMK